MFKKSLKQSPLKSFMKNLKNSMACQVIRPSVPILEIILANPRQRLQLRLTGLLVPRSKSIILEILFKF